MKQETLDKLIRKSKELTELVPHEKNRHFSFILRKNKVLSFGWNMVSKTSPLSWKYKYEYPFIHSETSAIRNFEYAPRLFEKCELVNVRVGKRDNITIAKPCDDCMRMLASFNFRRVWYTDENGNFCKL